MLVAHPLLVKIVRSHKRLGQLSLGLLLFLELVTPSSSQNCPVNCTCTSTAVECINQGFSAVPKDLPKHVKVLSLSGNNISQLSVDSFTDLLTQLTDLHLTGNKIEQVEPNSFTNLPSLRLLDLSNNRLHSFSSEAFLVNNSLQELNLSRSLYDYSYNEISSLLQNGTPGLSVLDLSNNNLLYLPENIFSNSGNLSRLNLRNNSLVSFRNGTLKNVRLLSLDLRENSLKELPNSSLAELSLQQGMRLWLGGNPWNCDCIEDLVVWLRGAEQVVDRQELACAEPERLRRVRLLQLNRTECSFSNDMKGVLETSYVFLGMVLALIGVIFLFVLYLNRKGIKRWMYNIRDACRDHMEGYHYRYEINSDPRLANLSLNSDV
ncbi:trophoblast glycoprotein b [Conger conger]|uniref:trophoblast glycoprotein b n=1 Tax=Conger conger TaxID=82655 RepID=UPI002A598768|nr:trophoblast glycoprotein b [Conger conger]